MGIEDQSAKNLRSKVIRGAFWSLVQGWGSQFGSLVIFFLLARLLDPGSFGLIALASAFLAFMQVFLSQGFSDALVQRKNLEAEHLDAAFWTSITLGSGLMLLGISTSNLIADLFSSPELVPVLRWFSIILLINSLSSVHQAQLQRQFAFRALAIRNLLGIICGGIIGIMMALRGWGVWALVGQQFTQELIATLILWYTVDWQPRWQFSTGHLSDLLNFGVHQSAFSLITFLNTRADDLLIGYYLGSVSLGYYSLAYRILTAMTNLLVTSSSQIALPTFARLQDDLERFRVAFYQATKLTSAFAFPLFSGVAVLAPQLINILFGEAWLPSVPVLQILAIVGALRSVTYFKGAIFLAMDKPNWRLQLGLMTSTLNIAGFFMAVQWGIVAVASAYLACAFVMFPIGQIVVTKLIKIPFREYLCQFMTAIISTSFMVLGMSITLIYIGESSNSTASVVYSSIVGLLIYISVFYCLEPTIFRQTWRSLTLELKK